MNYPLPFTRTNLAKTGRILRILGGMGVEFKGRRVLDIGCGTGNYCLPLALKARSALGVDSSTAMLKVFRAERRKRGIKNAACLRAVWSELPAKKLRGRFDIALASMTMAIKNRADLLKMEAAAGERCVYIGWAGVRRNALMEKVYTEHGLEYKAPRGAEAMISALRSMKREYSVRFIKDSWVKKSSPEETLRELEVSLRVNGARMKTEWVKELLKKFTRRGSVVQTTTVRKALITWRVPAAM